MLLSFSSLLILLVTLAFSGRLNPAWSLSQAEPRIVSTQPALSPIPQDQGTAFDLEVGLLPEASVTSIPQVETIDSSRHAAESPTATPSPTSTPPASPEQPVIIESDSPFKSGTIFLSILETNGSHLFAYHPQTLPFTRLTQGNWEDITPAASPDGARLAFASNRDGQWDLYILDLSSGLVQRVTATPEYDANPAWSPDGQWLVYETYQANLEIFILQIEASAAPIRLTEDPAADFAPAWSPAGRQIAFVSNRSGEHEIWLADLDRIEGRFQNISRNPASADKYPAWSPDGNSLAWSAYQAGYQNIFVKSVGHPGAKAQLIGAGDRPIWHPGSGALITTLPTPNQAYLSGYIPNYPGLALPSIPLPGPADGLSWGISDLALPLPEPLQRAAKSTSEPGWQAQVTPLAGIPGGRQRVVELADTQAPYPMLNDLVDEAFMALRVELANSIGWDYLASLENAFVPLTSPLFPGMLDDWLLTGRAIALNPAPINAGWMLVTREDYGAQIYWRIFLRARFQDGSQGKPLVDPPWNFNARYSGDPRFYEDGGAPESAIPGGYWLDFTRLAVTFGWQRQPALITWRSALPAARFNEFALTDGLDWLSAMIELYPAQALATPTPVLPPTHTPTPTRWPTRTPIPTRTPWPTRTPSPTPASP